MGKLGLSTIATLNQRDVTGRPNAWYYKIAAFSSTLTMKIITKFEERKNKEGYIWHLCCASSGETMYQVKVDADDFVLFVRDLGVDSCIIVNRFNLYDQDAVKLVKLNSKSKVSRCILYSTVYPRMRFFLKMDPYFQRWNRGIFLKRPRCSPSGMYAG